MSAPAFDTAEYCNTLKDAGVPEQQVDGHLKGLKNVIANNLATKQGLKNVKTELKAEMTELKAEIGSVRTELKAEIGSVRTELKAEMTELKTEIDKLGLNLTIRLLVFLMSFSAIIIGAIKYLP